MKILLLSVPLLEIYLLIRVSQAMGILATVLSIILSAALGLYLLESQNRATINDIIKQLQQGRLPLVTFIESAIILCAGILLLVPGFSTDLIGLVCILPKLRQRIAMWVLNYLTRVQASNYHEGVEVITESEFIENVGYR